jgi:hypothetical protein
MVAFSLISVVSVVTGVGSNLGLVLDEVLLEGVSLLFGDHSAEEQSSGK